MKEGFNNMQQENFKKALMMMMVTMLTLAGCMSSNKDGVDIDFSKMPDDLAGLMNENVQTGEVSYTGKTYSEGFGTYDLTNYDVEVANGDKVSVGDTLATSKKADLVREKIALNNDQIATIRANMQKADEQKQIMADYRTTLGNEINVLENDKNTAERQLQATADPSVQTALEGRIQMLMSSIDNKKSLLAGPNVDGQSDQAGDFEARISALRIENKELEREITLSATKEGVVKLEKENKLSLLSTDSFVKINISEKELPLFKKDMALTCKVVYLDEAVPCSFFAIDDSTAESSLGGGGGGANPFNVSIKLGRKYYNNVTVKVSFTNN